MAFNNRKLCGSEDSENTIFSEIAPMSEEFIDFSITTIENQDKSICEQVFEKFEHFKQEATILSNSEITKVFADMNETDLFYNDNDFLRQIYFSYLDLLNTNEIQQFLTALAPSTLADSIRESNIYILLFILSTVCRSVLFFDNDIADQYNPLLKAMQVHIDQKLQNTALLQNTNERLTTVHQRILLLLCYLNDRTVLVPSLLRAGFGKSVIEWLNYPTFKYQYRNIDS
ncbi:unnamed protein product [Rotaria sp. Silwood1]|nr:unnamed protein product [Rotaria sp. Silwood1]CAF0766602.1 unnamed protein product [Rotaria sp. Silwood1]CAF3324613.1 unnamed protein product [Rotaria sp. Silwood1]CAF3341415.1 unnamed protein product [Rotaria sp. Silwood1]CAF3345561.1 unnamed protein product [Rotaria sp. Silwood1]